MFVVNPADPGVTKHEWAMQSLTRYLKGIKDLGLSEHDEDEMLAWLVFAGPVRWTGKKTEIGLNPIVKDQTTGCSCTNSEFFSVASCDVCRKIEKPKKTGLDGCNQSFIPSRVGPYTHFSLIVGLSIIKNGQELVEI